METMLNLTRFNTIQKCINIHFVNYSFNTMSYLVTKFNTMTNHPLLNIYEHYYTLRCNNVIENNKMNKTKNNERQ